MDQSTHRKGNTSSTFIYIGPMVSSRTRMKIVVDELFELGLRLSSNRRFSYPHICNVLKIMCPRSLKANLFTTSEIQTLSSSTAVESFYAIGISVIHHLRVDCGERKLSFSFPNYYTLIPPTCKCIGEIFLSKINTAIPMLSLNPFTDCQWLSKVAENEP